MVSVLDVFVLLGAAVLARATVALAKGVHAHFLRPGKKLRALGQWAIVTGATDGIGKAYCFELARKGLNVVLISRTLSKLEATAAELRAKHPKCETKLLAVDCSNFGPADRSAVDALVKGLDVGVLVNNVGVSYEFPQFWLEVSEASLSEMLAMNVVTLQQMTRAVLPGMAERRRGAIVNISSAAASLSNPLLAEYSATKAYVDKLSAALHAEYAPMGVTVQSQAPLFIATKLAKVRKASLTIPSPATYVAAAVRCIGYEDFVSPYWAHALQLEVMSLVPTAMLTGYVRKLHLGIRKRGMARAAAKKE